MDSPGLLLALCLLGVAAGVYLLWRGLGGYRTAVTLGDTATSSITSLAAGEVRITGTIEPAEVTLVSPLQSVPCVWYRARVEVGRRRRRRDLRRGARDRVPRPGRGRLDPGVPGRGADRGRAAVRRARPASWAIRRPVSTRGSGRPSGRRPGPIPRRRRARGGDRGAAHRPDPDGRGPRHRRRRRPGGHEQAPRVRGGPAGARRRRDDRRDRAALRTPAGSLRRRPHGPRRRPAHGARRSGGGRRGGRGPSRRHPADPRGGLGQRGDPGVRDRQARARAGAGSRGGSAGPRPAASWPTRRRPASTSPRTPS